MMMNIYRMTIEEAIKHCEEVAEKNDDFKTATEGCEYWHKGFDDFEGGWIDTCRHPDNITEGCSWGECDFEVCPIFENCIECASEHRQLAEWLRELWALTEAEKEIRRLTLVCEDGQGIQKCIDILDKWHGGMRNDYENIS